MNVDLAGWKFAFVTVNHFFQFGMDWGVTGSAPGSNT